MKYYEWRTIFNNLRGCNSTLYPVINNDVAAAKVQYNDTCENCGEMLHSDVYPSDSWALCWLTNYGRDHYSGLKNKQDVIDFYEFAWNTPWPQSGSVKLSGWVSTP